jgi:hypothetical protein
VSFQVRPHLTRTVGGRESFSEDPVAPVHCPTPGITTGDQEFVSPSHRSPVVHHLHPVTTYHHPLGEGLSTETHYIRLVELVFGEGIWGRWENVTVI